MRIRKRKVPLPLSLLSPIPLSDPNLFSRSSVTVVQGGGANTSYGDDNTSIVTSLNSIYSQPSDHSPDLIFVGDNTHKVVGEGNEVVSTSNDDASNAIITRDTRAGATPTVDNTDHNIAGWGDDGDKAIPLKKRRGSFNNFIEDINNSTATVTVTAAVATTTIDVATTTTPIMIKIDVKNGDENEANTTKNGNVNNVVASAKKGNNKRGNTIMEGSRCSRVNGRGWRCCQPTLVGYSLCEHHLGKGRLRSMTSGGTSTSNVKARSSGKSKSNSISNGATKSPLGRDERKRVDNGDDNEKKLQIKSLLGKNNNNNNNNNNRKAKLGVIKARSLSSLLGQTNNNSMSSLAGDLASMEHHEKVIEQL